MKDKIVRRLIKLRNRYSDYFLNVDKRTVSWIVDRLKWAITMIPEETNTEARFQFESKPNMSSFGCQKLQCFQNCS